MINCWNLNPGGLLLYNATLSKWLIWMVHWNKRAFFLGINVNYVIVVSSNDDIILYLLNLTSHFISLRYPVSYSWPVRVCVWSAPVTSPGRGPYIFTCDVWETLYAFDRWGGTLYIYLCHEVFFFLNLQSRCRLSGHVASTRRSGGPLWSVLPLPSLQYSTKHILTRSGTIYIIHGLIWWNYLWLCCRWTWNPDSKFFHNQRFSQNHSSSEN